jgi:D-glycero-D-manno-heptose 1,7-bisphosphate phosphatase
VLRAAVFLDRDGTLIEERNYISRPEQVQLLPGVVEALVALRRAGFACVVVTNQSGIGRGMFGEAELASVHAELNRQLQRAGTMLDGIHWCPVAPRTSDKTIVEHPDRKPGPGMLQRAARELGLDLAASWMVGDSASDVLAGRHAGCRASILLRTGHDILASLAYLGDRDLVVDDLAEAARWILRDSS